MLMYLFSVFLIFYLKLDIYNKNNIIYSYGPSTNVVYIISTICVILCFVSMIKNYKELKKQNIRDDELSYFEIREIDKPKPHLSAKEYIDFCINSTKLNSDN